MEKTARIVALLLAITAAGCASVGDGYSAFQRQEYEIAFHEWRFLAEQGDASAQRWVGHLYEHGLGVPQDYGEAVKW